MKISIIIPVLNAEKFINIAIDSLVTQSYTNWELLIIDDLCTDSTERLVKDRIASDSRISWVPTNKNVGISEAVNKGIKLATGDLIGYSGADDWFEKDVFATVVSLFIVNPEKKWLYGDIIKVWDEGGRRKTRLLSSKYFNYTKLFGANYIALASAFIKPEVFLTAGYYDPEKKYAQDHEFWLRIGRKYEPIKAPFATGSFLLHDKCFSSTQATNQVRECLMNSYRYAKSLKEWVLTCRALVRYLYYRFYKMK